MGSCLVILRRCLSSSQHRGVVLYTSAAPCAAFSSPRAAAAASPAAAHPRRTTSGISHARRCGRCEGSVGLVRAVDLLLSPRPRPRFPHSSLFHLHASRNCSGAPNHTSNDGQVCEEAKAELKEAEQKLADVKVELASAEAKQEPGRAEADGDQAG